MITSFLDYIPIFKMDIPLMVKECIETDEAKKALIGYNQEQLQQGIDAKERVIETIASQEQNSGYPYSRYTVAIRGSEGLQVDNVDLRVTGEFYNSMEVKVTEKETEILADFNKGANDIRDNFDKSYDFLGVIQENLKGFGEWVLLDLLSVKVHEKLSIKL